LIGPPGFERGQNVIPESAQFLDHTTRKVLVGIKAGPQASRLA
jgi:hypothetical protein